MAEAMIQKEKADGRWDASVNVGYMRQDFGYDLRGLTASGSTQPIQDVFHYVGAGVSITLPVRNQNQGTLPRQWPQRPPRNVGWCWSL